MEKEEFATPTAPAVTVESAPTETKPENNETIPAVIAEPAPVNGKEEVGNEPEEQGLGSKGVEELKAQRKRRQEAERLAREKEVEAAYLRGQLEALKGTGKKDTNSSAEVVIPIEPVWDSEKWDSFEAFQKAERRYAIDLAKYELRLEMDAEHKTRSAKSEADKIISDFNARIEKAYEDDPDIMDAVEAMKQPGRVSDNVGTVITASEYAAQLIKFLNANPKELAKLNILGPMAAAKEIGKIEARILNQPKPEIKRVSSAPEPLKTVTPVGATITEEDDLPIADYIRAKNAKQFASRKKT
jgi:hypothetical protein